MMIFICMKALHTFITISKIYKIQKGYYLTVRNIVKI